MEALTPTLVATMSFHSQMQNGVASLGLPLCRQDAMGSIALGLQGDFRQFLNPVLVVETFGVGGCLQQPSAVHVSALDAAQPFEYESKRSQELEKSSKLKIGIVGFGNFGQFLAERIVKQGHRVLAQSRRDYSEKARG